VLEDIIYPEAREECMKRLEAIKKLDSDAIIIIDACVR